MLVTDSTACIPPELIERYGIEVVPVHIILGGRTYVDSVTADTREFYARMEAGEQATTAAPSPGQFLEAIRRAAQRSDAVLVVTVSKQFSAMYDSARQAVEQARAESPSLDVRLLDSRAAAMAQGFVVLEAARAAERGASVDEAIARAEMVSSRVTLLAMLDTLAYLARSGRVPRVAAWAAGMLQVKPVVRFSAEGIRLVARTRTRPRALAQIAEMVVRAIGDRPAHLAVHHANAPDDAAFLREAIERRTNVVEAYTTEFTQVMGVHTGPGLVAAAWWCEGDR